MSVTVVAEIGINHNGSLETARRLVDAAVFCGADVAKFQKRTPDLCVPEHQRNLPRDTPWGRMTYMAYRERMEFGRAEYDALDAYCRERGIAWTASVWDPVSLDFLARYDVPFVKVPSALLTDTNLIRQASQAFGHVVLSTGMSTPEEMDAGVAAATGAERLTVMHCHSAYPAPTEELNLRMVETLGARYPHAEIGYSGHEYGIRPTLAAVALGATMVERHITLDHEMWGSDHAASVEPPAFFELVKHIRSTEAALGDGRKRVWASELPARKKLRREAA